MWTFGVIVAAIGFIGVLLSKDPFNDKVGIPLIALLGGKEHVYRVSRWFVRVGAVSMLVGTVALFIS